jgi:two-component system, OmpR family, sensor histidine kinase QseC
MRASRSIRARLLVGILLSLVFILGTTAWWGYEVARHESEELFGARLATSARVLEALVSRQLEHATVANPIVITLPNELQLGTGDEGTEFGHPYETKIAFQVWRGDGSLLAHSMQAPKEAFGPRVPGFSRQLVDGVLCHVFVLRSGNIWIQVAEQDEVRAELVHDLGVATMTPLVVGALLSLLMVNLVVVYGLAPLRQLAASIQSRDVGTPDEVRLRDVPREIAPVVRALNELLARVQQALERERRFTDAAAHELRTPLAALVIHAENASCADTESKRQASMRKLMQGLKRTTNLAAQMLAYSRTQNVSEREERVPLVLLDALKEALAETEMLREDKAQGILLDRALDTKARILGEPIKIRRLLVNVLDNASRYAPQRGAIEVSIFQADGKVNLRVVNPGRPIPLKLRDRVFDPYYRVPGSESEGSGLGLAIVKDIAEQHGATVTLSTRSENEGTAIQIAFTACNLELPPPAREL